MIISIGFRVNSKKAIKFRTWANKIIKDYMVQGFALNDERFMKARKSDQEYFKRLLERIKLIRTSERMFYQEIRLSNLGKLRIFKIDNEKEIKRFTEMLKSMRYDINLLDDFLIKQDLDLPVWRVLDLVNLNKFCNDYNRAIAEDGASTINFIRLESDKKTILTDEGKKVMQDMLSVWDNHCIHICHPNHLFAGANHSLLM